MHPSTMTSRRHRFTLWLIAFLLAVSWGRGLQAADPNQGPGGPILVITSGNSNFGRYYAEILRNEGLNLFAVADIADVTPALLAGADLVVLARMPLSTSQAGMLSDWVGGGGRLIAMAPPAALSGLLGIAPAGGTLSEGYLKIDTARPPGQGISGETLQFHGSADRYTLNGATSLATLYSSAGTATPHPALTLRSSGAGMAAAFTFDLATSIVYTRQGNPAWARQERDGLAPIRSDDKFFGQAEADPRPDWLDPGKLAIPQADEQQRLLVNLILHMTQARKPLPRFWYFPNGKKAVVIMTGDDHGNAGTPGRFERFKALSLPGCSVADWECIRGTSYVYPDTPISDARAAQFNSEGFEIGLHLSTRCADYDATSLNAFYAEQIPLWRSRFGSIPAPLTQRHHCIVWSDWSSGAEVQLAHGIRLDTSYYHWPAGWVNNRPGVFTGSAMPMRFARLDGSLIDVYMAATQMTDESGQDYPFTVDTLLDRALGPDGYFGAYTVNAHTDVDASAEAEAVVASAQARKVPVVTARQMLTWLDARNGSSFGALSWNGGQLSFSVQRDAAANGLQALLPMRSGSGMLSSLTRNGSPLAFTQVTIKGVQYAAFAAASGPHLATYLGDNAPPAIAAQTPAPGSTGAGVAAPVTVVFNKPMDAATLNGNTFQLRGPGGVLVDAAIGYDETSRTARLTPSAPLAGLSTYTARLAGGSTEPRVKDLAGIALPATVTWSFTTAAAPPPSSCPCGAWSSSSVPTRPSVDDANAVEVGVKFRTDVNGFISGLRFYKGSGNTGTHVGHLWRADGTLLASATFSNETASGWQQVNFSTPVAVTANTVYVASYFAPNGHYAGDNGFFAGAGVHNGPIHLLANDEQGGNGVYLYGPSGGFPTSSYLASNYWVDVVFDTGTAADSTPPQLSSRSPGVDAAGVATGSTVTAVFNEAMDPASVNGDTVQLRTAANALVSASVAYDAGTRTATLTPTGPLATSTTYTVSLRGGAAEPRLKDSAGNALANTLTWSFTTGATSACPCSAWPASASPEQPSANDTNAVEIGVKFKSDLGGFITGLRFYKGSGNTGTHVGNLWTLDGTRLASATFSAETASGWQQVKFATPVPISANTVYVASYHAPNGHYAGDNRYFASAGVDTAPIHLLRDGAQGGNGVYRYGTSSAFPTETYLATNYWVDVVFTPSTTASASTTAPTSAPLPAQAPTSASLPVPQASPLTDGLADAGPLLPLASLATLAKLRSNLAAAANCAAPPNPIVAENCLPGNPASEWDVNGAGDPSLQGFTTAMSVNRGERVYFKIKTNAASYRLHVYRLGWYGGLGARKVATLSPSVALPQAQPACLNEAATGLIDCGNWAVSASWLMPYALPSGVYVAKLVRSDTGGASHIVWVVRSDAGRSDLLFQTSDTTWQAYNNYGGNSLYTGAPAGRAYKVSYNRPFNTREVDGGQDWLFNAEYPMIRWLEANGYHVSYLSGGDTDRSPWLLLTHKVFLSVGHDEYWSAGQRAAVEAARNAGGHLAFFSGNEVFWKTRWESSIDAAATPRRTLVSYKETHANAKIDPSSAWTGTWRDPRFSPPADGGRPENALTGTLFLVNDGATTAIQVPAEDGKMRFWRQTSVATLPAGGSATLADRTLGYEWDVDADNGVRPPGLIGLSRTTVANAPVLKDHGSTFGEGTATHRLSLYRHASGAKVFGAGTVQWPWGLDAVHDRAGPGADQRMQQATVNLLADMNVQPGSLQPGLVATSASTDGTPPVSALLSPAAGTTLSVGQDVTIRGTASDTGGAVGGVEVSVDGGASWRAAQGRTDWIYRWTPTTSGSVTLKSRAVDDSGNLQSAGNGVSVTVGPRSCPCSLWSASTIPMQPADPDGSAVNLGVKFKSDIGGRITGIRFYKGAGNTGPHVGSLWSSSGQLLASVSFTGETASGWQQANFATPVSISANTVYVASYHAPAGRYAVDEGYFAALPLDSPPLHALKDGSAGGNGVYRYGAATAFPDATFGASNYWVDVVFAP